MSASARESLFPALLRYWRNARGMSQLDLAVAAGVSSRHVSFLETGRSAPTSQMVLRLGTTLGVPLRHVNSMLRAAGHAAEYPDEREPSVLTGALAQAVDLIKTEHEPFPVIVLDRHYNLLDLNNGAMALLAVVGVAPDPREPINLARFTFDPHGGQQVITNYDRLGRELLWRLQREALADPDDADLRALIDEVQAYDGVPEDWREADLSATSDPCLPIEVRARPGSDDVLKFLATVTMFQAPQNVAAEGLRIEAWYPTDEATRNALTALT